MSKKGGPSAAQEPLQVNSGPQFAQSGPNSFEGSSGQPSESTPLLARGLDGARQDFDEALREETGDPKANAMQLLVKRPGLIVTVFALFCLLVLLGQSLSFADPNFRQRMAQVPQYSIKYGELQNIGKSTLQLHSQVRLKMDYTPVRGTLKGSAAAWLSPIVSDVKVSSEDTIYVRALLDGEYLPFISASVPGTYAVKIADGSETVLDYDISLFDAGRSEVIGAVINNAIKGEEVRFQILTDIVVSKWGLEYRVPVKQTFTYQMARGVPSYDATLIDVSVHREHDGSISADCIAEVSVDESIFPIRGVIPALEWSAKLSQCDTDTLVTVGSGQSHSLRFDPGVYDYNISVSGNIPKIPPALRVRCPQTRRTPLDKWISGYLNGDANMVYATVVPPSSGHRSILHDIIDGVTIGVPISGKSASEKLVDSVRLDNVRFDEASTFPERRVTFSATVTVVSHLPGVINIDETVIVGVQRLRGDVFLYHDHVEFGSIYLNDWVAAVTERSENDLFVTEAFLDHVPFDIEDSREFAAVSRELISTGHSDLAYDAILDLDMLTPLGGLIITNTRLQGQTSFRA